MARRMLDSATFQDEFVGELSVLERLLWIGLITACADDQGRLPFNPAIIRATIFPYDEAVTGADISASLEKFADAEKVVIYQDGKGRKLIQIASWWKHQRLQWAQPSIHPAPEGWTDRARYHTSGNKVELINWDKPGGYPSTYPAHSYQASTVPTPQGSAVPTAIDESRVDKSRVDESRVDDDDASKKPPESPESAQKAAPPPSSSSDFSLCANQVPKNAAEAIRHPAILVYRTVTGLTPARKDYEEIIAGVVVCQVKNSLDPGFDLVEHLRAYFDAYKARRTKAGSPYDPRGLAWLTEWAASGQIPPDRRNGKIPRDYALPEDAGYDPDPTPTDPAEWHPEPPPDLKTQAGQLSAALEQLRADMPPGNHKHLKGARLLSVDGDAWIVRVPPGSAAWCQDRLAKGLQRYLSGYANQPQVKVIFQEPVASGEPS
jgi:hypothetical protein